MFKLSIIKSLFKKNWKAILLVVIALGFAWHYQSVISDRNELRGELQSAEERIERFVQNEEKFIDAIETYNERTQELRAKTDELEEEAKSSRERRREAERDLNKALRDLDRVEIGESCEAAMEFMRDQAIERKE